MVIVRPVEDIGSYIDFRCARCCFWSKGRDFENDPAGWSEWHRMMITRFGAPVLAAYEGDKPVGMVMFSPLDIAPKPVDIQPFDIWTRIPEEEHRRSIILYCVFVPDDEKHGRGIGDALMTSLTAMFRRPHSYLSGEKFMSIYTIGGVGRPGPSGPSSFFERYGFSVIEELEETCLLMRLDLV